MKIAIFRTDCSTQDPASYNSQEMGLAKGFQAWGHVVDIVMASGTGQYSEKTVEGTDGCVRVIEVPFRLIPILNEPVYSKVAEILRREKYDYVQINEEGNFASYLIAQVCSRAGVKFGIYQGMYRVLSGRKWALYEAVHHRLLRPFLRQKAVGAFCKTSQAQSFLEERGYRNSHVVPVGLDFSKFQNRRDRDWRDQLGLGQDDQLVLYVGQLEKRRNPEFIAELASESKDNVHFVLVGEGPSRTQVEAIQQTRNLKNLHLLGQLTQEELPSLYEQADVFVLPSEYEIYGMVVIESLLFGTPVVSTGTAGPRDIIREDTQGQIVSELGAKEWLNAIGFYNAQSAKSGMNEERTLYAKKRFDWKEIAKDYLGYIG
ncbi:glycosyltransferase family 4 protein [Marinobacter sp.]|uniref:glycosyltransferase family 4 protein n=1 Tax=Marinobacter sp. TaxID=50741 RepID=UPI003A8E648A